MARDPICMVSIYRHPEAKLATLKKPLSYELIGIAMPPNDPLLINWVENFLHTLEKIGDIEMLMERWFKNISCMSRFLWGAEARKHIRIFSPGTGYLLPMY